MKLLMAAALVAFPLAAYAQTPDPDLVTIDGNGGTGGTATATVVLTPAGGIAGACTNVTSCVTSIAPPPAGSSGAQVSHVVGATGTTVCRNSPECSEVFGY